MWIFAGFAIAFAIKAPLVPLHTWLPDAGTEAPVGAGTLLVGVLDKVGTFGFLRICLPLLPAASAKLAWLIILLAVIGIVYGAIVAAGQTDLKRFVTFTSIAHFGFIALGVFAFTTQSIAGAAFYMVNHGIATGLLFIVVGMLTARGGSKLIGDYGGVWKVAPILGGMFLIASLATIAMPGTNSFISEFLVLIGTFTRHSGLGRHRHHRHRAGRRLHAVDLPADDDRPDPRVRRAGRRAQWRFSGGDLSTTSAWTAVPAASWCRSARRRRRRCRRPQRAGRSDGPDRRLRRPGTTARRPRSGPSSAT